MTSLVQDAQAFSARKHGHQTRKHDSLSYIVHIEGVVEILRSHGIAQPVVIAAAYLHDTVEKTDTSVGEMTIKAHGRFASSCRRGGLRARRGRRS